MTGKNPNFFRGLIVENSFESISAMVDKIYWWLQPIKNLILRIGWDSDQVVPDLKLPILYITGDDDEIVPYTQTLKMHEISRTAIFKDLLVIKGGRHNTSWYQSKEEYLAKIHSFLKKCMTKYQQP